MSLKSSVRNLINRDPPAHLARARNAFDWSEYGVVVGGPFTKDDAFLSFKARTTGTDAIAQRAVEHVAADDRPQTPRPGAEQ